MDRYLSDGALNNSCELERNLVHLKAEVERKFKQIIPCYILIYCLDRYSFILTMLTMTGRKLSLTCKYVTIYGVTKAERSLRQPLNEAFETTY